MYRAIHLNHSTCGLSPPLPRIENASSSSFTTAGLHFTRIVRCCTIGNNDSSRSWFYHDEIGNAILLKHIGPKTWPKCENGHRFLYIGDTRIVIAVLFHKNTSQSGPQVNATVWKSPCIYHCIYVHIPHGIYTVISVINLKFLFVYKLYRFVRRITCRLHMYHIHAYILYYFHHRLGLTMHVHIHIY